MIINKSYMEIMRAGKSTMNYPYYNVRKQNDSGIGLSICIILALVLFGFAWAAHADCKDASPEVQKAFAQLQKEGFDVSCRRGL